MPHLPQFDENDPLLGQVRRLALVLPDAAEKVSHGRPAFFTQRVFAYYGGSVRREGQWLQHPHALVVKTDEQEARALAQDPRGFTPAYLGASGWIGVDVDHATDWGEISELLDSSYRLTAPPRASPHYRMTPRL